MDNCSEKHNVDEMKSPDKKSLGRKEPKIATEGGCFVAQERSKIVKQPTITINILRRRLW